MVDKTNSRMVCTEPLGLIKERFNDVSPKRLTTNTNSTMLAVMIKPGRILRSGISTLLPNGNSV